MSSINSQNNVKQVSILDKVNQIIKTCVKLRDQKHMTGDKVVKANEIIELAKEKERKILKKLENNISETNSKCDSQVGPEDGGKLRQIEEDVPPVQAASDTSRSASPLDSRRTRSITRSSSRSSRSWKRGKRSPSVRERSDSRERWRTRVRPRDAGRRRCHWIAVTPCVTLEAVSLERNTTRQVSVVTKDQFWFPGNSGMSVKMTKWTGQDHIEGVHVSPQIVKLTDNRNILIDVENPYDEKVLKVERKEKLACMSVLSTAIPRFSKSLSPDR